MNKLNPDNISQTSQPAKSHLPKFIHKGTQLELADCLCVLRTHLSEELDMKDWCISDSTPE
jgi:hypothetical protein